MGVEREKAKKEIESGHYSKNEMKSELPHTCTLKGTMYT